MTNSVDPDETARYEPSHLDLHGLQRYLDERVNENRNIFRGSNCQNSFPSFEKGRI